MRPSSKVRRRFSVRVKVVYRGLVLDESVVKGCGLGGEADSGGSGGSEACFCGLLFD